MKTFVMVMLRQKKKEVAEWQDGGRGYMGWGGAGGGRGGRCYVVCTMPSPKHVENAQAHLSRLVAFPSVWTFTRFGDGHVLYRICESMLYNASHTCT